MVDEAKTRLRTEMRARRKMIPAADTAAASAARHMMFALAGAGVLPGAIIAVYASFADELDTIPLVDALVDAGYQAALPVVTGKAQPLEFRLFAPGQALAEGAFGVREPLASAAIVLPDVIVVPMLAFDERCGRLGYGGGFYDRTIAALRAPRDAGNQAREHSGEHSGAHSGDHKVFVVGLAYEEQRVPMIPMDQYDQRLDAVVTDRSMYWSRKEKA